jgi:AcrR family transcriptional regulator
MSVAEPDLRSSDQSTAPARSRAATRRRLIDAAIDLFAHHGLHGVTSARIARAAGVATGTFYLHFRDKQALFEAIVQGALAELRGRLRRAIDGAGADARAQVRARTAELVAFAEDNGRLIRVLFGRRQEAGALAEDVLDALIPGIEESLRARAAAGEVSADLHPGVAAQAIAAMSSRVLAWWVEDPTRATRDELIETLCRMHPVHR